LNPKLEIFVFFVLFKDDAREKEGEADEMKQRFHCTSFEPFHAIQSSDKSRTREEEEEEPFFGSRTSEKSSLKLKKKR
jgi:hypothetical protein